MDKALKHFKENDPILYSLALKVELNEPAKTNDLFFDLVDSIIQQQLSEKAGATISKRFVKLFPNEKVTPENVLKISDEKIRGAGLSYSKIKYIKGIAKEINEGRLDLASMDGLKDEEVIAELIKQHGIGNWTAEMFLMFTLQRPDVFSLGDLGLKNAISRHYKLDNITKEKMTEISAKWTPYRTIACRILWRSLELKD